jgi:hypothetical protein
MDFFHSVKRRQLPPAHPLCGLRLPEGIGRDIGN